MLSPLIGETQKKLKATFRDGWAFRKLRDHQSVFVKGIGETRDDIYLYGLILLSEKGGGGVSQVRKLVTTTLRLKNVDIGSFADYIIFKSYPSV